MWLPLSLTTPDNAHDKKTNPAHFSNPAPQSAVPFRVAACPPFCSAGLPFHYHENDHMGGFETLPYSGRCFCRCGLSFLLWSPANKFDN
jgi:hypothetical protein